MNGSQLQYQTSRKKKPGALASLSWTFLNLRGIQLCSNHFFSLSLFSTLFVGKPNPNKYSFKTSKGNGVSGVLIQKAAGRGKKKPGKQTSQTNVVE